MLTKGINWKDLLDRAFPSEDLKTNLTGSSAQNPSRGKWDEYINCPHIELILFPSSIKTKLNFFL